MFSSKNSEMNHSFGYYCTSYFNVFHKSKNVKKLKRHFTNITINLNKDISLI